MWLLEQSYFNRVSFLNHSFLNRYLSVHTYKGIYFEIFQYLQERVAYQKLLKAYNQIEAQYENSQDELNAMKNPHGSEMNFDRYVSKYSRVHY